MVSMETFGDRRLDLSIPELGGTSVFSKEVQQLVLAYGTRSTNRIEDHH